MLLFLFAFVLVQDAEEITATLSPAEKTALADLPEDERSYALRLLQNKPPLPRSDWSDLNAGELFFGPRAIRVDQIVDDRNFIGYSQSVWVEGLSTAGLADDDLAGTSKSVFFCTGNKKYTTVLGGSKTVMHAKTVDTTGPLEVLRPISEARGYRVWGEGGDRLVLAKFLKADSKVVVVESLSGKRVDIKKVALTAIDREWVDEQETIRRASKK